MGAMRKEKLSTDLIAFFALLVIVFTGEIETRSLQQICSSSCGDIRIISYPFRLKGDPAGCGDSDYELSCENNRTIMEFNSAKYYVKRILYEMREIRIVDVNFANGTCNLPYKSLTGDDLHNDIRYRGFTIHQTFASFMNCSTIISDPAYPRLPCLGGNTSSVYVLYDRIGDSNLPLGCYFISMIPIDYNSSLPKNPSYEAVLNLLESGFNLGWSVECRDCLLSNSSCLSSGLDRPYKYDCYEPG
ncbi:unnamed protein product [Ilex paraguariensis]|uniref:Wall-associated receptor kinase galacturonan-binding domain-containing protein n=1 Tax=Ilex paraguariensis TaxID=185542 RepID=A0ABC8TXV9_9AQUA